MVRTIEMIRDGFVGISVPYGAKMSSEPAGKTTASFTNVEVATFVAGNAINDVRGGANGTMLNNEIRCDVSPCADFYVSPFSDLKAGK